ncbi:MAG: acetyl-CoA C-acyltransferase [Oceanospirillaceae bacterium]|uniref:acetyl-CoA C-acetyltransferase n=1 Tax=unclassified Thalassolituus TaxID=2624967 RepID=UPI000C387BC5|nr:MULTISPECIES: acetyl-CoA C-acetyltransferase [unclassified Thalassolituus]MAS24196.1 acetyl-CoA C-acyltransferase [Oceanospirillaceae bacterium]MAX98491.1 acetyl-CoA C-acyltransferase [Oceanospirillaceae bacterium]MBL33845.1 acetyl-CoA C-acyltransferase [Oceanospirillaceae bacterium]MBS54687.1 acetyl-CoA C-acyltransferase [Oceanospirillaceae bacterium]|tara:strand:- start:2730 stop:4049 length:1320 start_codon:yes stop_codon:yes gene_type:complete
MTQKPLPTDQQKVRRVAIIGGNRIPFARSNTAYSYASNQDMLTAALNGLVNRYGLQGQRIGEVIAGAVIKHSRDFNLARESLLSTSLDPHTPATDIQQACGTGLQAIIMAANKIALGQIDSAIAGGSDTTSDAPIGVNEGLRKILLDLNRAKTMGERLKLLGKLRPRHLAPLIPRNGEPRTGKSMGEHTEETVKAWGISRGEQDQIAFNSHQNLLAAYDRGFFDDLLTPFNGLAKDNLARKPDLEKLASLKPAFDRVSGQGTLTAGNSSALTDGASVVLLASEDWAEQHDLPVKAWLTFHETAAVDFFGKDGRRDKEGLLLAPAYAVPRMLARAGLTLQDFDFYEIHEAFAGVVASTLKAWEDEAFCREKLGLEGALGSIDRTKLNINGSSIATGHPFAATGGRIVASLAKMLEEKGSGRGLISICAAGGQGVVAILER